MTTETTTETPAPNENFDPPNIESAVAQIAYYAREHKLTPAAVCDIFSAGLCAARILAPDLAGEGDPQ